MEQVKENRAVKQEIVENEVVKQGIMISDTNCRPLTSKDSIVELSL